MKRISRLSPEDYILRAHKEITAGLKWERLKEHPVFQEFLEKLEKHWFSLRNLAIETGSEEARYRSMEVYDILSKLYLAVERKNLLQSPEAYAGIELRRALEISKASSSRNRRRGIE